MRLAKVGLILLLAVGTSRAAVYNNATCYQQGSGLLNGEGRLHTRFPLASVSKVMTSLWALERLGAHYRFSTVLHMSRTSSGGLRVHIEGSRNPLFGRNLSYFLISELNRMQVQRIDSLTFDENLLLAWKVEEPPYIGGVTPRYHTIQEQTTAIKNELRTYFATSINQPLYERLRSRARDAGVFMQPSPQISLRSVGFLPKSRFRRESDTVSISFKSSPLITLLKRMNNQSNNYLADHLFWNLGGRRSFASHASAVWQVEQSELHFVNGSGNNEGTVDHPIYNEGTCAAVLKILQRVEYHLSAQRLNLTTLLPVADIDSDSTLSNFGGLAAGAMSAKTGTVNKAKTLAGFLSSRRGFLSFVILLHMDQDLDSSDSGVANQMIKNKVGQIINLHQGPQRLNYSELITLPFDQSSYLSEIHRD